jgi:hypothetical protein
MSVVERARRLPDDARRAAQRAGRRVGIDLGRLATGDGLEPGDRATIRAVERFTMTSPERIAALCEAARYVARSGIEGDVVECGVWRGGSMMAVARTLLEEGEGSRNLLLYDTFAGMTEPGPADRDLKGHAASAGMERRGRDQRGNSLWCNASLEDVRDNLASTGYPLERCRFVEGPVEETIPAVLPGPIALLRLDTDWYESTAHELRHLFPLLVPGGVLVIDDYGHWQGARRAVDEYLASVGCPLLLQRIDYTGRMAVLPGLDWRAPQV